jgi:DNA mismatch endonuclease (patch repair protein)
MEKALRRTLDGGAFRHVPLTRSKVMRSVRSKGNRSTETRLRLALVRARVSGWVLHSDDLPGKPDFYFRRDNLAVFADGCFWHGCPACGHIPPTNRLFWATKISRNKNRDLAATRKLKSIGISVIRLWEHDIQSNLENCVREIRSKTLSTGDCVH